jgi:hypothetical protein
MLQVSIRNNLAEARLSMVSSTVSGVTSRAVKTGATATPSVEVGEELQPTSSSAMAVKELRVRFAIQCSGEVKEAEDHHANIQRRPRSARTPDLPGQCGLAFSD